MYGSPQPATSKDPNFPFGHRKEEADLLQHRQHQMSSGLLRYRSAPSSLIGELCDDFLPVRTSSPETETMFAHFGNSPPNPAASAAMEAAAAAATQQHMLYQSHQQQQIPSHSSVESLYRTASSSAMEAEQLKSAANGGGGANLIRQSSSPAGLFSHLNVGNGYGMMRGMSGFRNGTNSSMEMDNSGNRLKTQLSFSSRQGSLMSQISETGSEGMDGNSPEEDPAHVSGGRCYIPGYPIASWEDSSLLPDNFSPLKRAREAEGKIISGLSSSESQNGERRNHVSGLGHQFNMHPLTKTSSDMAAYEKLLQFQDSVPCKIRAKRGCATHPRSIAERVRRTRISERMRKLQELVPNMDKQTNTADMLDLAVEHIKDLQKQVKTLKESKSNCTCSASNQRQY
ncbi:transcription factor bHLH130-like [Typha latifolia]|uniref:transcription factor bHLH130-like n=1 Tax=Typha latifolia TaxID=4733 RepID=UPI003C2F1854